MSESQGNSIQEQLAERRRRLEAGSSNRPNQHDDTSEPMDVDPPFRENRHEIEQEIVSLSSREFELQSELQAARDELAARRARLGLLRDADVRAGQNRRSEPDQAQERAEAEAERQRQLSQTEQDHEIALLLQRQMERELAEEDRARREQQAADAEPSGFAFSHGGSNGQGGFRSFAFSSSGGSPDQDQMRRMMMMFSSRDPFERFGGIDTSEEQNREQDMFGGGGFRPPRRAPPADLFGPDLADFGLMGGFGAREHMLPFGRDRFGIPPMLLGALGPFGVGGLNVDLDNMDHDQILRLQEMIGHVPRGASVREISELPTSQYHAPPTDEKTDSAVDVNDEKRKCSICLEQFEEGDQIRTLPCFHIFHSDEVDKWLQQNSVCPICREPINSRDNADVPPSS